MPEISRQKFRPKASLWQAMITLAAVYDRSDQVKMARRPKRSASQPQSSVPMKSPVDRAPDRGGVEERADPRADEPGHAARAEQSRRCRGQDASLDEARCHVAGE